MTVIIICNQRLPGLTVLSVAVSFTFRQSTYTLTEDVLVGKVCVDKLGSTVQTWNVMLSGGMS